MHTTSHEYVLLTLFVVVVMTVPAAAVSADAGMAAIDGNAAAVAATSAQETTTQNNSNVNVTVGQQLSTVIGVSSNEVQTDFENTAFEMSVDGAGEEEQAEAIADRAEELREQAEDIREDYVEATEAYEDGEISKSDYAQRLASLNARATNLLDSYERLQQRAQHVSALELRAAGVNQSALDRSVENLSSVSGAGTAALLEQFTGESQGEIEIETADGLKIEIESEDGEQSREFERPRDADQNITVSQSAAFETAGDALSSPENGTWTLTEATVERGEGAYEFEFVLRGAATQTGEAEVSVDGSSGEVFKLEEEIEPREDDEEAEDERSREIERPRDDDRNITVNQSVALEAAQEALSTPEDGRWVLTESSVDQEEGAYEFEFALRGTTDWTGEAEVAVDGSSGEFFRLEEEIEPREDDEGGDLAILIADGTPEPGATVTLQVLAAGEPSEDVTVTLNDQVVGTTAADGTITVTLPASGDAELKAEKGDAEDELEFEFEEADEDDEVFSKLAVDASLEDDTVTVTVRYDGSGVANATIYANDQRVGTTGADGTVTFPVDANATEELELEIVKGAFEAELEYEIQDGALVLTEEEHEGDGDQAEDEEEEDDEDVEEDDEDDEDEEEEDDDDEEDDEDEEDED